MSIQENQYINAGAYHWRAKPYSFQAAIYTNASGLLGRVDGLKVLDYGGGDGFLASRMEQKGASVDICDVSSTALALAQALNPRLNTILESEIWDLPDGIYDKCAAIEVLEHIRDDSRVINLIFRLLAPGALFVVSVPSVNVPVPPKHIEHYSWEGKSGRGLKQRLEDSGFDIVKTNFIDWPSVKLPNLRAGNINVGRKIGAFVDMVIRYSNNGMSPAVIENKARDLIVLARKPE